MEAVEETQPWRRRPSVERRLVGARRLVQPLASEVAVVLAGSAPFIWDALAAGPCTTTELIDAAAGHYDDDREALAVGVHGALELLRAQRLIESA